MVALSSSGGSSNNWSQHGRALLKVEEVMQLSPREAITFAPGVPPIRTTMVRYYEEKNLEPPGPFRRFWRGAKLLSWSLAMLVLAAGLAGFLTEAKARRSPNVSATLNDRRR